MSEIKIQPQEVLAKAQYYQIKAAEVIEMKQSLDMINEELKTYWTGQAVSGFEQQWLANKVAFDNTNLLLENISKQLIEVTNEMISLDNQLSAMFQRGI